MSGVRRVARAGLAALLLAATCRVAVATECSHGPDVWFSRYRAAVHRVTASVHDQAAFCAEKHRQFAVGQAWLAWHLGHPQCSRGHPRWEEARLRLERLQARVAGELAEECP